MFVFSVECEEKRGLTVYVVHGEAVGEVGHVGLLPEGRFLQGFLRPPIVQALDSTHKQKDHKQ